MQEVSGSIPLGSTIPFHVVESGAMLTRAPFVLLEDARANAAPGRLFSDPVTTIEARTLDEVGRALDDARAALRAGRYVAGWMSYEAGRAFEPRLARGTKRAHAAPLVWFGVFEAVESIAPEEIARRLPDGAGAWISAPRPRVGRAAYDRVFARAKDYIVAGDIYQVNLSYRADVTVMGAPEAAYARLREAGRGGWSALVCDGASWLLSTSPELFFRLSADGAIEARPMKGTAKRHADSALDQLAAQRLRGDPKELAENVMIVDLLRNDISKLAKRGSVRVPELFTVETYPTLHTLTSTVRAEIREDCDAVDVLRALFPCGSITGAPKVRAMEIIDELESDARGPYSGSIGWMAPDGRAEFSVAIRTLVITERGAEVGLGSAVVFDSNVEDEWEECRTKGAFLTAGAAPFELFETMRFDAGAGINALERHLARLGGSATALGFVFDEAGLRAALDDETRDLSAARVLRLALAVDGRATITQRPVQAFPRDFRVALLPLPVEQTDFRLRHKTTLRGFYDDARAAAGVDEVVFFDRYGFVTEGSFTNVFVERDGVLVTPPLSRGLLPGVLRGALIDAGKAAEADVRVEELQSGFLLGNSVRGLTAVPASALLRAAS